MKLQFPFLQLPVLFDAAALAHEVASLDDALWRARAVGVSGNSALTLVTTGGDPDNDELAGAMRPTPALARCPQIMQLMATLGATWGRSRLMRLYGQSQVAAHVDTNYYWQERMRVHIPIVTTPAVRFQCGDAEIHMAAGECWVFDTWRRHRVVNPGDAERTHLVLDTVGGDRLWQLLASGRPAGAADVPQRPWQPQRVVFDRDAALPALDFETCNVPVVMTPWEVREHIVFLLGEAIADPRLGAIQRTLSMFMRNWHAAWACHGERREGWPRYRALLGALESELVAQGANALGLRNEVGLMHALGSCILGVALADGGGVDGGLDRHGEAPAPPSPPAAARQADAAAARFDRPVFIVSPPRSGSTLLFETLATAPGVYTIGDESHRLIEGIAALDPAQRNHHSNRLLAADASPAVAAELRARFAAELRDREQRPANPGAACRMLEKTPKNALRIAFLRQVFPDARFVYLHRDPRQVLGSMLDGWQSGEFQTYPGLPGWSGPPWSYLLVPGWRELAGKPLHEIVAEQWRCSTQLLLDDLDALPRAQWIGSDYARLLRDPQAEIARLCAWAGFDWDRQLTRTLPLSRYTLSAPAADKWRRHAAFIEPALAALHATVARAADAAR